MTTREASDEEAWEAYKRIEPRYAATNRMLAEGANMSSKPQLTPEQRSLIVQARREIERVYSGSLTLGNDLETAVERVLAELVSRVLQEEMDTGTPRHTPMTEDEWRTVQMRWGNRFVGLWDASQDVEDDIKLLLQEIGLLRMRVALYPKQMTTREGNDGPTP